MSNFSLGNTAKVSYTERLNNFVQRFSQDLTLDSKQKTELLNCKKRFSQEARMSLGLRFAKTHDVKAEERIKEIDESDGSGENL